ncbi:MAG: protein kinase domain-containing protein [Candidatus Dormibacterales bacterium]
MIQLGRFTAESEIGRGAMGVVYRAQHPGLEVPVAIKVLAEAYSRDSSFRTRFKREAATIAALNHPGLVRVYDFDEDRGFLFIVMEYVEGRSLRSWLQERGGFPREQGLDLIQQLLSAVGVAHSHGVIHRDLKPENVLISTQGKTKILDFGVSKLVGDAAHLTGTGSLVGTPAYMPPEQVKGEPVDSRADVYALGVMFYEILHGTPPFMGSLASVLHSQVYDDPPPSDAISADLMGVMRKAMAKDPASRFETCEAFAGAVLAVPAQAPPVEETLPAPTVTPAARPAFRIRLPLRTVTGRRDARSRPTRATGTCGDAGCQETEGWGCAYRDQTGRTCSTWWCRDHVQFIESTPFCRRHASVMRALAVTTGTIREIKILPGVDDRSLSLAALVGEDIDKEVTELLRRRYKSQRDVSVVADQTIRQARVNRNEMAWERTWAAVRSNGYVSKISVRVEASSPAEVQVLVGSLLVMKGVPDWISRRLEGKPPDPADRVRFRSRIVQAVLDSVDQPTRVPAPRPAGESALPLAQAPPVSSGLLQGMVLRLFIGATRLTGYEIAEQLALPFTSVHEVLDSLTGDGLLEALGFSTENGPWRARPLPERMAYAVTRQGRQRADELGRSTTRYVGPAPVSLDEYAGILETAALPVELEKERVEAALEGLELPVGVAETVRAAVNSRASVFIYGSPGNGKTSLARRLVGLLGGPILVPVTLDLGGEVIRIFDPAVHRVEGSQPGDRRWKRVARPVVQVGGEFQLEMLEPTWEEGTRTYIAPLQVKANGGVLLLDDLGRQKVAPKQILDRLLVPMEQSIDYLGLTGSGRTVEVPFKPMLALSTNLRPADLLDEAYLRRLSYKVPMPDPTWEAFERIFDRERQRLCIPPNPQALELIAWLYGDRPRRGNHPRDLLERLVDVASARRVQPVLNQDLIEAAWATLFIS